MAIGDSVMIGVGGVRISLEDSVPVYDIKRDKEGAVYLAPNGLAYPEVKGGVKGGTTGTIKGDPVKVFRSMLVGENVSAVGGLDFVMLFPVFLNQYNRIGWFPSEHMKIV